MLLIYLFIVLLMSNGKQKQHRPWTVGINDSVNGLKYFNQCKTAHLLNQLHGRYWEN